MAFYGDGKHNENMEHVSPTLKEFEFFFDQKVTTWMRTHFTVEAETKEDAIKIAVEDHKSLCESESWEEINDVRELLSTEDNGGETTEELYFNTFPTVMVWENGKK